MTTEHQPGKIITFYSYKGGTGRSMALANMAWILASNGHRVLMIDWDLEAPGLYRYFHPFLLDPELTSTEGLIDFVSEYFVEAMTPSDKGSIYSGDLDTTLWYEPFADITHYAVSLSGLFPVGGTLDLVPAGRQGARYAARVNSFNWQDFYERLGGGGFLELVKDKMRAAYDYILIDSRTGVSDTAGICTVQMPDILAVCFTFNIQSIEGAAAVAESVLDHPQRAAMRVFPIPMRVELAEKDKLETARMYARQRFGRLLSHIDVPQRASYWGDVEILYQPFYAYEELLATFGDRPEQTNSVLAGMERITGYLTGGSVTELVPVLPDERDHVLELYARQPQAPSRSSSVRVTSHHTGHFISYSVVDAEDFVIRLTDALEVGSPSIPVWLDRRELSPGQDWDEQIIEAIRTCESLIFVMTRDSVGPQSVSKQEWTRALQYRKPVIPILLHADAEIPFRLSNRHWIDFTGDFDSAVAQLRSHLQWLASSEGELQALKDRLGDAERDLRRADPEQQVRIQDEIDVLQSQIAHQQQYVVENPQEAQRRVEESIERGLERERKPRKPVSGATRTTKFINPLPARVPRYFQDREVETRLIGDFLEDDALCMITVVGRGGIGKTAMVCRLLKALEGGRLPDDGGPLGVDGIVYLSEATSRRVTVPNLYTDLCRLLSDDDAEELQRIYKNPQASTEAKMHALLEAFQTGRYILLLDSFEHVINPETRTVRDTELNEALRALLNMPQHAVKVVVTTRFTPRDLGLLHPERQARIDLDRGLESPYAENILREMDVDGKVGLKTAPDELLAEARRRTRGNPRALEALFAILSADCDTSLREVLDDAEELPGIVVEVLVGEAFSRLDTTVQMVMQALAIYGRPVTPAAVDYLLQPHLAGVDSAPVLNRLVNMQFARKEAGRYYLHGLDLAYALSRVPEGEVADRQATGAPRFTRFALWHRAARYFEQTRTSQETWKTIEDLAPQLAEFDLRFAGQDYDTAVSVLLEIDFDYLLLWGHSRLVAELHERLQGKLSDPQLQQRSVGNLGIAYYNIGRYQKAITCYEQALEIARDIGDRGNESWWLGNLGICYSDLGQAEYAVDYYEQALEIAREIGDRSSEGFQLGNLGNRYLELGQKTHAIKNYEQALEIAREIEDRGNEGVCLVNLGICYSELGQTTLANEYYKQALEIAREIGNRSIEAANLHNLGDLFVRQAKWDKAARQYEEAIQIADEIGYSQTQNEARSGLELAGIG